MGKVKASFWSGGDKEGRRRWEPGEVRGDTSSGGTWGNSHLEVRGEVKQRPGPTVWGAVGSPRGELDAEVPRPTQVSSALSLNSSPPPSSHPTSPGEKSFPLKSSQRFPTL